MKVFLSWSGEKTKSHAVARALDEWLPTVLNAVEPWVSSRGLVAGLQWNQQLDKELDDTNFGIIVVTPWNQHSQWLSFEAGALSKRVGGSESRVAPLLIDFPNVAKLTGPLSSYQVVLPDKDGMLALVVSINQALGEQARKFNALERAFEVCWPSLESALEKIDKDFPSEEDPAEAPSPQPSASDDNDMLSEILNAVRGLARSDARLSNEIRRSTVSQLDPEAVRRGRDFVQGKAPANSAKIFHEILRMGYPVRSIRMKGAGRVVVTTSRPLLDAEEDLIRSRLDSDGFRVSRVDFQVDNVIGDESSD